jgi:hypothetical protein
LTRQATADLRELLNLRSKRVLLVGVETDIFELELGAVEPGLQIVPPVSDCRQILDPAL